MKTSTIYAITRIALVITSVLFIQLQTVQAQWLTSGSNVYYNGGSVGIGTSSPTRFLQIANTGTSVDLNLGLTGPAPSILFSETHTLPATRWSKIGLATAAGHFVSTSQPGDFVISSLTPGGNLLFVTNTTTTTEVLRILNNGNVGIGTTAPTARLHNKGSVRFENLPSGTGNILVADNNGNVFRSSQTARISSESDEIAALKEKIDKLEEAVVELQQSNATKGSMVIKTDSYQLEVSPNPVSSNTTIRYSYPSNSNTAFIDINDQAGKLIKRINIKSASKSTVNISADDVAVSTGTYICSLEVDGKIVTGKKIVFVR